ncbi:MAG: hypothetical protein ABJE95_35965 [Byssovorax sp.]
MRVPSRSWACFAAIFASFALATTGAAAADPPPARTTTPPDPVRLDLGLHLGGVYRAGDAPAFPITDRAGASFGVSAFIAPSRRFSLGLAFEHAGLGGEKAEGDLGSLAITRDLNLLWAGLRAYLISTDTVRIGLLIGPGLAWQGVDVSGVITPGIGVLPSAYACSASATANLALRAGVGARFLLGSGFSFLLDASFDNVRLASDVIGDCAPGAGTVSLVGARAGFGYEVDITRVVR